MGRILIGSSKKNIRRKIMRKEKLINRCIHCGSKNIVKNGTTATKKQKFYCKYCGNYGILKPLSIASIPYFISVYLRNFEIFLDIMFG